MNKFLIAFAGLALLFASCDNGPVEGPALKPDEQKEKIENTARKLMEVVNAQKFQDLSKTVEAFTSRFNLDFEEYDITELQEAYAESYEETFKYTENGELVDLYYNFLLANFQGKVTFGQEKATVSTYEGTMFEWTDEQNETWTAELTQVGTVNNLVLNPIDIESEEEQEEAGKAYITVGIPEKLIVKAAVNGKKIATVTISFDVNLNANDIEIGTDSGFVNKGDIKIFIEVSVDDLTLKVDPISASTVSGTTDFKSNIFLYMAQDLIIGTEFSVKALADGDNILHDFVDLHAFVNIMDEIQVEGKLTSYEGFMDYLSEYIPENNIKGEWETAIDGLNKFFDVVVRYNNTTNVQATFEFEAMENAYDDELSYYAAPVIVFNDGSRFTFENIYENEEDSERIEGLLEDFESWTDSFLSLFEALFFVE